MTGEREAAIARNRFGLGARPGELARAAGEDARGWLAAQVRRPESFALKDAALPTTPEAAAALAAFLQDRRVRQARGAAAPMEAGAPPLPGELEGVIQKYGTVLRREAAARVRHGLTTDTPFAERLVYFWANHFTVAAVKATTVPFAGVFEREVIRAGMTGRFADLALAAARHPGMLLYLDQAQSVGPNSLVGRRRDAGLNENLAREILELHTLGPQGGYTQADVTEFAKALTGWTVAGPRTARFAPEAEQGRFVFVPALHEPGARTFMGKRYPEGGEEQGRAMLLAAARHPATARRVAHRLVRHLVADQPPPAAVAAVERVFLESEGDLPALHGALVAAPEAWSPSLAKFKTPNEFILSALRAVGAGGTDPQTVLPAYELLGQPLYRASSPEGWADDAASWAGPDPLMKRLEWCQALAGRLGGRTPPERLAQEALGPLLAARTRAAVVRAESASQGLALALMSPEFQRR